VVSYLFLEEVAAGIEEACGWSCRQEYSSSDTCSPLVQQSNSHCGVTTWGLCGWWGRPGQAVDILTCSHAHYCKN